ncbi:MAG: propionyl-CoA carboxylase [Deltaproteobacteria bacterium]|nr:propionyl-CoA carboxylase [Deltaproteobacteria bacterium]
MPNPTLHPIGRERSEILDPDSFARRVDEMRDREVRIEQGRALVADGWGDPGRERVHKKKKLTTWERIDRLKDPDSPVHAIGTFVNFGLEFGERKQTSPGAGVVTAHVRVHGRWVMVIANDNTVASGSWWPKTPEKIERAQEIARRLRTPVIYLVDCSGLFLPEQARTFPGGTGAGHIFKLNARLSADGVPQLAGVFGDCIAGGGYMPIISDKVYMTEQAYMVIAGAALIKGAKAQHMTSHSIGGPDIHVGISGCADFRVPDDETCLLAIREEIAQLPTSALAYYRYGLDAMPPRFDPKELQAVVPADHRVAYDVREVIARLVDGSLFWEVMPDVGREVVVGIGRISGLYVAILANASGLVEDPEHPGTVRSAGILYRHGIAKLSAFSRAANDDGIPLLWLQDISGFDIGPEAERHGLLAYGSSLIYTNSTNQAPMATVLLRKASGAGYYAMAGLPYDPVLQLSTPVTRLAVMEGRTLAIGAFRTRLDDDFRPMASSDDERAEIERGMKAVEDRIEADMDPIASAKQMDTDEVVLLGELRERLVTWTELCYQSIGHRRVKNPRIWSLHDLAALMEPLT